VGRGVVLNAGGQAAVCWERSRRSTLGGLCLGAKERVNLNRNQDPAEARCP